MLKKMTAWVLTFALCMSVCEVSYAANSSGGAPAAETVTASATDEETSAEETGNLKITYYSEYNEDDDTEVALVVHEYTEAGTGDGIYFNGTFDTSSGTSVVFEEGTADIQLRSTESITIYGLPAGTHYYVTLDMDNYYRSTFTVDLTIAANETVEYRIWGTETIDIPVSVVWVDESAENRPDEIEIALGGGGFSDEVTLTAEDNWTYTYEDQIRYMDTGWGVYLEYDFSADYDYDYEITGDAESGFVITCTQILDTSTYVNVVWDDNDDKNELRPWYVNISLLMNGEVVRSSSAHEAYYYIDEDGNRVNVSDDWKASFYNFDLYSPEEIEKSYSIQPEEVEGYTYTITGSFEEGYTVTYTLSDATEDSTAAISLAKCNVSYINNTMDGFKVVWNQVSGATGYYIYRRNDDGTYNTTYTAKVTGESTTSWTDPLVLTGGKDYTYKVAAYYEGSDGTITVGSSGTTKTCKYLKGGEVTSVTNTSSGLKVAWTKVDGANGYYIFRKSSSDSDYTQVATVSGTSAVSWTDTSVLTSGKNYTYKVSAIFTNSKGQVTKGGALTTKTAKYLTAGKISSLTNTSTGITVKWSKVSGASGYYVYRKASSASSYTLVKTITSVGTVSYTDTAVKSKNGTTYTYYVIPYYKNSSGAVTKGAYSATKKTVRLTAVSLSSVKNSSSKKMTVKWAKNSKATGYEIQYSTSSSFASGNKTVTVSSASTVSKVISSLTKGKTYYVRVRAYKTVSGTKYYSAWSSKKSVKISK